MRLGENITDDRFKDTENSTEKIKEIFKKEIEKIKKDNDDTNTIKGPLNER